MLAMDITYTKQYRQVVCERIRQLECLLDRYGINS